GLLLISGNKTICLVDKSINSITLFIQVLQLGFLYLVVGLVFISIVNVPVQVHDVSHGYYTYLAQGMFHLAQVAIFPAFIILLQVIYNTLFYILYVLIYVGYIDLFIYLHHLLEKLQEEIIHLQI